ncbi:MAG: helix-turn-helix transcriptional regulator [Clostridia bacterium]|nr:helix-turn-helix transcriptional regulator [Clostridia bacterium]
MYVNYKEVGRRIAERRRELGLKQFEVNEMAGLSDKYLSNIERASSVPSIDVLMKLCDVLKTTPDHLLLGTTVDKESEAYKKHIQNMLSSLNEKQLNLALGFIEWISMQSI